MFHFSSLHPSTASTVHRLAEVSPHTLALMHGPAFTGDGASALQALAQDYNRRIQIAN
jgi:hypothetical protein